MFVKHTWPDFFQTQRAWRSLLPTLLLTFFNTVVVHNGPELFQKRGTLHQFTLAQVCSFFNGTISIRHSASYKVQCLSACMAPSAANIA